jgi:uncharacterized membrane protein (UPF0136 family)
MEAWWQGLTFLTKGFVAASVFFSVLFAWQLISLIVGIGGEEHSALDHPHDLDGGSIDDASLDDAHPSGDLHDLGGEITFSLVSVRSCLAFGMLFSWAGALYLISGTSPVRAVLYGTAWGAAAMFLISYIVYRLLHFQEAGNISVWTSIGEEGSVYLNVPEGGRGKVRVMVGGTMGYVNAKSTDGSALEAGTPVIVTGIADENTIEVEPIKDRREE